MVEEQLIPRGIRDPLVLEVMGEVPRHRFVPPELAGRAYGDNPLPIGLDQTISQPYMVACMTELLVPRRGMRILEIGTGSGYQAAVLSALGCEVFTMELQRAHAERARGLLVELGYGGVRVTWGNGYGGWPEEAPFEGIIVTAAPEAVPPALIEQLAEGGRMVIPVGPVHSVQHLKLLTKAGGRVTERVLFGVRFVPMAGA